MPPSALKMMNMRIAARLPAMAPASAESQPRLPTAMPLPHCIMNTRKFMAMATAVVRHLVSSKLLLRLTFQVRSALPTADHPSCAALAARISRPTAVMTPKPVKMSPVASITSARTFIVSPFFAAEAIMMIRHARPPATTRPAAAAVHPKAFPKPLAPNIPRGPIPPLIPAAMFFRTASSVTMMPPRAVHAIISSIATRTTFATPLTAAWRPLARSPLELPAGWISQVRPGHGSAMLTSPWVIAR